MFKNNIFSIVSILMMFLIISCVYFGSQYEKNTASETIDKIDEILLVSIPKNQEMLSTIREKNSILEEYIMKTEKLNIRIVSGALGSPDLNRYTERTYVFIQDNKNIMVKEFDFLLSDINEAVALSLIQTANTTRLVRKSDLENEIRKIRDSLVFYTAQKVTMDFFDKQRNSNVDYNFIKTITFSPSGKFSKYYDLNSIEIMTKLKEEVRKR